MYFKMQFVGHFKGELPGLIEEQNDDFEFVEDGLAIITIVKTRFFLRISLQVLIMSEKIPGLSV